jgi:dTDP-4-amino-4,6-dideoxygalactose transaminase
MAKRQEIAKRYDLAFQNKPNVKSPSLEIDSNFIDYHAYHLYVLLVEDRLGLYNYLKSNGIFAQIHYYPVHLMPYYRQFGWKEGGMPQAENYYKHCISLPMYPNLSLDQQSLVITHVLNFFNK